MFFDFSKSEVGNIVFLLLFLSLRAAAGSSSYRWHLKAETKTRSVGGITTVIQTFSNLGQFYTVFGMRKNRAEGTVTHVCGQTADNKNVRQ